MKLQLKFLDHFEIRSVDGEQINLNNSKAEAIIAYLALCSDGKETRQNLSALLWSRHPKEQARASLRQCLSYLKGKLKNIDENLILADRKTISLNHELIQSEFDYLENDSDIEHLPEMFNHWDGGILIGLDGVDERFDEWLENDRQRLISKLQQYFEECFEKQKKLNNEKQALKISELLLKLNPASEFAHRGLMELFYKTNQTDKAINQYNLLISELNKQTGGSPSSTTSQLYSQIINTETNMITSLPLDQEPSFRRSATNKPVISLLPINIAVIDDADPEPLKVYADVLNSELVTNLARFREFNVKEITDCAIDEQQLSEQYGVEYLLKGQIISINNNAKLNIRISTISTATQLWANTFEYENTKIFQSLNKTVSEIIDVVKYSLTTDRYGQSTENLTAYDYWLKASVMNYNWTRENEEKSITFYRKAIALDSDFARAYSSLASVLNLRNNFTPGYRNDKRDREEAKYLIRRALELDPMDARNHINAAWGNILAREFDEAEYHLNTAFKLNPRSANIIAGYSMGMGYLGEAEKVLGNFQESANSNLSAPLYHYAYLGILYFLIKDYERSCKRFQDAGELMPTFLAWHASALYHRGYTEISKALTTQFKQTVENTWDGLEKPSKDDVIEWLIQVETLKKQENQSRLLEPLIQNLD